MITDGAKRSRGQLAERLARDIPEGWWVNLGIGLPTLVAAHVPPERETIFHSENGVLGMGPPPRPDAVDPWLINAGKRHVTLKTGGSYMHQADSFALARGGHLDLCVLGAFEISERGDIANWKRPGGPSPGVGGAMDLAVGCKRLWAIMEHVTKDGRPRLVEHCTLPLTAAGMVQRVYSDLAVIDVTPNGFEVIEMVPGVTFDALQARTQAKLHRAKERR